jgi:[ribosomal protein S5]-alanine N-acetyltransferase
MTNERIQTPRLELRPFAPNDAADVFAYASNPRVSRFTSWKTQQTLADAEAFIAMVLARGADEHTWAIRLRTEPRVIGAIEFSLASETRAEFHYVLAEEHWNRGLMTEAVRAVLDWGRARYPALRHIGTSAFSENVASLRVMEKCGLRFEGVHASEWEKFAGMVEERVYGVEVGERR